MNESMRELGQRYLAALWDAASSLGSDAAAAEALSTLVETITEAEGQLAGLRLHLLREAHLSAADAVIVQVRNSVRTTPNQAAATLRLANDLGDQFPLIATALNDGTISLAQAEAIVLGLKKLPVRFTRADIVRCQEWILEHVGDLGPGELRILATHLVEVIEPDLAERDEARRLAREQRDAHRSRSLSLSPDHHDSVRISGQLPVAEAAILDAQLDALTRLVDPTGMGSRPRASGGHPAAVAGRR